MHSRDWHEPLSATQAAIVLVALVLALALVAAGVECAKAWGWIR